MIILKIAIGDKEESFIEDRLTDGFNIISSDDNNRGKTIVMQSLMYAIGNEPIFPSTFDYKKYYHYVELSINGEKYFICRHNDDFVLRSSSIKTLFNGVSDFKRYWSKNISKLPAINKKGMMVIVYPSLFFQLFFVGQDGRNTSNIFNPGYYKKDDFVNMIYAYKGLEGNVIDENEREIIKENISKLKEEEDLLKKEYEILNSTEPPVTYLSAVSDKKAFAIKVREIEEVQSRITELNKKRVSLSNRRIKWGETLKELKSLNRSIGCSGLYCMVCGSTDVVFRASKNKNSGGFSFDVSTPDMRNEIISSINEKILSLAEEINEVEGYIEMEREKLNDLLKEEDVSLESILAYKKDIINASEAEQRIKEIEESILVDSNKLLESENNSSDLLEKRKKLIKSIIEYMNDLYKMIDSNGNLYFDDLFTKKNQIYSGSESTVFYLVRLLSFVYSLQHDYPIIMDSFRTEDLSTAKEEKVLELFSGIGNQIIFTTTLKKEEKGKYDNIEYVNHIDYSNNTASKILTPEYNEEFQKLMSNLSIIL